MKIESIRVDGYGVLSNLRLEALPPGLSVVHGANETGKSTLLDFLRGALFGFHDRRSKNAFRPPLRGGRHGGSLGLLDGNGRAFVLERYVDAKEPLLYDAEGDLEDPARLAHLLGGADETLFRNVFAFGLGELQNFESLDRDEIRELVFSAGVLGAGRSASSAMRQLDADRSRLVKPRQADAIANALRRELDRVESELKLARREAQRYPALFEARARTLASLESARADAEAIRQAAGEAERLIAVWPAYRERMEASAALSELGGLDHRLERALAAKAEIDWLAEARSGHLERELKQQQDLTAIDTANEELAALRDRLCGVEPVVVPLESRDQIATLARELPAAKAELRSAEEDVRRAEERAREAADVLELTVGAREPRDLATLEHLEEQAIALERLLEQQDRQHEREEARRAQAQLRRQLDDERRGGADTTTTRALVAVMAIGVLVAAAAISLARADLVAATSTGGLGVLVALLAATAYRRVRHNLRSAEQEAMVDDTESTTLDVAVARLAEELSINDEVVSPAVAVTLATIRKEREERRQIDALRRDATRATEELGRLLARRARAQMAVTSIDDATQAIAHSLGFRERLSLEGLAEAVSTFDRWANVEGRVTRISNAVAQRQPQLAQFEQTLSHLYDELGLNAEDDPTRAVRRLEALLAEATQAQSARLRLQERIARADTQLREVLGTGEQARRLEDELEHGEIAAWELERARRAEALAAANECVEELVGRLRDESRELELLRASSDVADLELQRESLAERLDATVEQWLVLSAARALLDRGIQRYERERQPKVIAYASELFEEVTDGRYVRLVAHEEEDGKRRNVVAVGANGERVDASELSRGTAEQLYLCLRLAFAATFAEQSVALPLVVDDVLVNFDPKRAAAVAGLFARVAEDHQVLAFTCHPHVVEHFEKAAPTLRLIDLG